MKQWVNEIYQAQTSRIFMVNRVKENIRMAQILDDGKYGITSAHCNNVSEAIERFIQSYFSRYNPPHFKISK
jgi:hypothetical protein